jgi:hypothetical protein
VTSGLALSLVANVMLVNRAKAPPCQPACRGGWTYLSETAWRIGPLSAWTGRLLVMAIHRRDPVDRDHGLGAAIDPELLQNGRNKGLYRCLGDAQLKGSGPASADGRTAFLLKTILRRR